MNITKPICSIVACDMNNVIGHGMKMPGWNMTDDFLLNFVPKTKGCPVIMGRITAETLGKPLPGRTNIVLTNDRAFKLEGFIVVHDKTTALEVAQEAPGESIWIIGGGQIYELFKNDATEVHITIINNSYPGENEVRFCGLNFNDYTLDMRRVMEIKKRKPATNSPKDKGNSDDAIIMVYVRKKI